MSKRSRTKFKRFCTLVPKSKWSCTLVPSLNDLVPNLNALVPSLNDLLVIIVYLCPPRIENTNRLDYVLISFKSYRKKKKRRWEMRKNEKIILEEEMKKLVNIYINNHNIVNWRRKDNMKMRCVTPHPEYLVARLEMWYEANQRHFSSLNNSSWHWLLIFYNAKQLKYFKAYTKEKYKNKTNITFNIRLKQV